MNGLAKLLGVDPEEYNHWQLHWLPDDPVVVLTVLAIVIPLVRSGLHPSRLKLK